MITIPFVRAASPVSGVCHVMCQSRKQDLKSVKHDDSMNRYKCTKFKLAKGIKFISTHDTRKTHCP